MGETWDRFTTSVQIDANKPLTQKQWENIHRKFAQAIEEVIAESPKLTDQIGHVHLGSEWDDGIEICP